MVEDTKGGNYLLSFRIPGPDWWFVMVYPKALIDNEAHQSSRIVLFLGLSLFVLYFLVVLGVTNRQVRTPLGQMLHAVNMVRDKQYDALVEHPEVLPLERKNEIGDLAHAFLDMARHVREVNQNLEAIVESRTRELELANDRLRDLSLLDGLTGVHNRRSFDRDLAIVFDQASQGFGFFGLVMLDLDKFKKYNDTYGHAAGDEALRLISRQIAENIRQEDRIYRYGGEEFAIIFNNPDADSIQHMGRNILALIRDLQIQHTGNRHGILTLSAGIVTFSKDFGQPVDMIKAADALLYEAKSLGGNCVSSQPVPN